MSTSSEPKNQLLAMAKEAVARNASVEAAVADLTNQIDANPKTRKAILSQAAQQAIQQAIYDARHLARRDVKQNACRLTGETLKAVSGVFLRAILDTWSFPDGTLMRDAEAEVLETWEKWSREKAAGFMADARFYSQIRSRLHGHQKVRQKWTEEELTALWAQCAGGEANGQLPTVPSVPAAGAAS